MTLLSFLSFLILIAGLVVNAYHCFWLGKEQRKLMERIHHLEMERDFPGYTLRRDLERLDPDND